MGSQRVRQDWVNWTELYCPWNSPGQNTGVGSLSLLQGIFPTQGSNPGLLHFRHILYQLSHKGSPRIEPGSPALQTDSLPTELSGKPQFLKSSFKKAGSAEKSLTQTILTYPIPPLGVGFSILVPLLWRGYSQVMLLLLLSHFSRVRLCATPQTAAHHAPPSLGFSRQEHWSGLPFPSPMHESEKWKWNHSVVSNS